MQRLSKIRSDLSFYSTGKWAEYIGFIAVALVIAVLTFKIDSKVGLMVAAGSIGLSILFICFYRLEAGIYGMLIFSFLLSFMDRMLPSSFSMVTLLMALPFVIFVILLVKVPYKVDHSWIIGHPIIYVYLISVAYAGIQVFNPNMDSVLGWLSYMRGNLVFIVTLLVFLYLFKDLKHVRFFFRFVMGLFFVTALYGCIQQKLGFTGFETRWIYTTPNVLQLYSLPGEGMRKFSFLSDPANFGTLMATAGLGSLILSFGPFKRIEKIILSIFTIVIFLGASYSGTRTAYLVLAAGIALYIMMTIYQRRTRILAFCSAAVLLMILFLPIYGNVTINRIRSAFQPPSDDASYDLRNIHRHMMQPFMQSHPFGNGVNTTMGAGNKYNPDNFLAGFPPDSAYFKMALEQGWVGLALNCIFFFTILFYAVHYFYKCRDKEIKAYYAALVVMLFGMMLGAYTQFTITSIPQNFIFVALVAVLIKLHKFDSEESKIILQS